MVQSLRIEQILDFLLLLLLLMATPQGIHHGQLTIASASLPLQKIFVVVLEPDGTSASTASNILDNSKGSGTHSPVICHG